MKTTLLFVVLWLGTCFSPAPAVEVKFLQGLGDTRYHHVKSDQIGRAFHIYVMVPPGYEPASETEYPTVYLLDGGGLFPLLTAYYRYLNFGDEIPAAIIVGISYGSDSFEGGNYRSTDYTAPSDEREYWGGAEKFQGFLRDELFPLIEQGYASDTKRRIIFGQSIGGQFVLFPGLTQPNMFWGHIASNPALHRNLPFFLEAHRQPNAGQNRSKLFVVSATNDDPRFRKPAQAWIRHWSAIDEQPWEFKAIDLENHSHMSAPPASFRQGMIWLFSGD